MTPILTRPITPNPPGVAFARYLKGLRFGAEYAREQFRDQPQIAAALDAQIMKATVPGMSTVNTSDLQQFDIYDPQTAALLAGVSAFEAAMPFMRRLPFDVPTPRQTDGGSGGAWVQEGAAAPVVKYGFDYVRLRPARIGSIYVASDELLRAPGADLVLRDAALAAQGAIESMAFLDPSMAPSGDFPGAITFGAPSVAPSLVEMLARIQTSGRGLALIGRLQTLALFGAMGGGNFNPIGQADLPRSILGVPCIVAPSAPALQLVLADLSEIAFSAGALEADLSNATSLEMESAPSQASTGNSPDAPVPTTVVSMYATNSTAFKISRYANWTVLRDGSVVVSTVSGVGSPM